MNSKRRPAPDRAAFWGRLNEITNEGGGTDLFAKKAAISKTALSNSLNEGEPGRPALCAMANAAGVNIAWLVAGVGPKTGAPLQKEGKPDDLGWITVNRFEGCSVRNDELSLAFGSPVLKVSPEIASRAFPEVTDPKRLVAFSTKDSFMDPDIIENEFVVCEVPTKIIPDQLSGILGVVINGQIMARYISMISVNEIMITHRKTSTVDAMRVLRSEIGKTVFILGRVLLAGAYVGNRHRDWVTRLQTPDTNSTLFVVIDFKSEFRSEVERGLSDLGIQATLDFDHSKITAFVSPLALTRIPTIPGVRHIDKFPIPQKSGPN